jgi:DNA-directed RNA polymerase specialized sigma24 family protein
MIKSVSRCLDYISTMPVEELDTDETASCLEISESNVKARLHRARLLLRQKIDDQIGISVRQI